jgi:hypothetical protein|tara:strand:- start:2254 stop:2652 length:399 start_codon:yes stop_codon:yes gene_type:complete
MNTETQQKEFLRGYIACALWSSTGDDDRPLDSTHDETDLAGETLQAMKDACTKFMADNGEDLELFGNVMGVGETKPDFSDSAGHDFWLTRNGHGAGFWDRGLGELGDRLSDAATAFGEAHLYAGDDGKLYLM